MFASHSSIVVVERILFVVLASYLLFISVDLVFAWNASACSFAASKSGCYPWGAEGPVGDLWNYRSKQNYLVSSFSSALITSVALLLFTLVVSRKQRFAIVTICLFLIFVTDPLLALFISDR